ncbi:hypothetical protein CKAH01_13539 [Colletotrichum kahawae]|uniref:Uncharacterized protein n=1 Tax=Colletotrichum kahawae TaxID=34407 RepID=A0AAD9YNG8_COLKA|nr:hypothetical protein CKAH01_13539 [Colletotrichum kahawae]
MSSIGFTPSGLVTSRLLSLYYREAKNSPNVEYKASAFWQLVLQRLFDDHEYYAVAAESSPDGSLRRVDAAVKRYDGSSDKMYSMLWIEFKRKKGSVAEVEGQALDAAKRVFQQEALERVFIMTTIGVAFRMWEVEWNERGVQLVPMDGSNTAGTKTLYIDALHPDATTLRSHVQHMKGPYKMPVYRANTVPSQSLPPMGIGETEQNMDYSSYGEPQAGPSNSGGTGSTRQWIQVKGHYETHYLHADEYIFRDEKNQLRHSEADRWKESFHDGEKIWSLRGKDVTYFTRE